MSDDRQGARWFFEHGASMEEVANALRLMVQTCNQYPSDFKHCHKPIKYKRRWYRIRLSTLDLYIIQALALSVAIIQFFKLLSLE